MKKMKIAIIFPKDSEAVFNVHSKRNFGGATVQLYYIAKEMANHSDLDVYSLIPEYDTIDFPGKEGFQLIKTYKEKASFIRRFLSFHRVTKNLKPDVVIQRGLTLFSCLLALYCKLHKIRFVFMFAHDVEPKGVYQTSRKRCIFFKLLLNHAHLLIVQNTFQQRALDNLYKKESMLIPNGYPFSTDLPQHDKREILWVARCERWKRPEIFLDLAEKNPDLPFTMICPPSDDKLFTLEIMERASRINNLHFLTFVSFYEIDSYFQKAKVFVNTSESEGFPNTFLQAVAAGTPILSLNVDPDGFIEKNSYGVVCEGSMQKLIEVLHILYQNCLHLQDIFQKTQHLKLYFHKNIDIFLEILWSKYF